MTAANNNPVTFFTGTTFCGNRWVLSFEGGPTATNPDARCRVSGRIGPSIRVHGLGAWGGAELRALLPCLKLSEVSDELWEIRREEKRRQR